MLVLLPPSETKAAGGNGPPLDLATLSFPELHSARESLLHTVIELCRDLPAARIRVGVPASLDPELIGNTRLRSAATLPAIRRYTGVLYDALDAGTMTRSETARAAERLAVASALFGLIRPADRIPGYRLSAGSRPFATGTIAAHWRESFGQLAAGLEGAVVDLRSGAYSAFGAIPGAIAVRVVTEMPSGQRQIVSHFNKHTKGLLARALAVTRAEVTDLPGVLRVARRAGLRVERSGPASIEIVTG
ncbi:YaaA family protein [Nakamurella lactea]|uniref:YaaA family protein n=1 Tax=Nakamurella lactea TaxID=459515 RepID=UPI0003F91BB8|nr:peroxide stress protein YaaA [Nakamurella lactea]